MTDVKGRIQAIVQAKTLDGKLELDVQYLKGVTTVINRAREDLGDLELKRGSEPEESQEAEV